MVDFDLVAALVGGLVATVVMTAMMTMASRAHMTAMPPMPLVMGSMMSGDHRKAIAMGTMLHYVVMGTIIFGIAYGALFSAFDNDAWWVGALLGMAHGLIVGLMFMPMMPAMHPRMTQHLVGVSAETSGGAAVGIDELGQVEIAAPGVLGKAWGAMTPVGLVMGHAIYGLVLAVVYSGIA